MSFFLLSLGVFSRNCAAVQGHGPPKKRVSAPWVIVFNQSSLWCRRARTKSPLPFFLFFFFQSFVFLFRGQSWSDHLWPKSVVAKVGGARSPRRLNGRSARGFAPKNRCCLRMPWGAMVADLAQVTTRDKNKLSNAGLSRTLPGNLLQPNSGAVTKRHE